MTAGERIRLIRKQQGMNQTEFANEISLSTTSVCQLEIGKYQMARTTKKLLCDRFHINPVWLEPGKGSMYAPKSDAEELIPDLIEILDKNPMICKYAAEAVRHFSAKDWKLLDIYLTALKNMPDENTQDQ